ncbi:MAG: NADH-quinone oxidoreductase subunit K [Methanonatronarchaeales archaeon]|nr:NADH-quinone oxidoreductase subunit K [Methanonatronarchaeales archaeon]
MIPVTHYLALSSVLLGIGTLGILTRRHTVVILMCVELIINAALINFAAFSSALGQLDGHVFVLVGLSLAASEAALGLAIVLLLYRNRGTVDITRASVLKW